MSLLPISALPGAPAGASPDTLLLRCIERQVALSFSVSVIAMQRMSRGPAPVALARQCAMYLAHVSFGVAVGDVARFFGRDRATAVHACHIVEDRRDENDLDAKLSTIEQNVRDEVRL